MGKRRRSTTRSTEKHNSKTIAFWSFMAVALVVGAGMYWALSARSTSADADYVSSYTPAKAAEVVAPTITVPSDPRLLIMGDSYTEGTGASKPSLGWAQLTAAHLEDLGWEVQIDGIGSTGWTWGGGENGTNPNRYADRIERLKTEPFVPNVVIIQGGQNDYRSPASGLFNAVKDSVDLAQAAWPNAQVVIFGPAAPQPLGDKLGGITSSIHNGATEKGAPFIDPFTGKWMTLANSAQFAAPDGSHVNDAGHSYISERFLADFALVGGPPV